MKACDYSQARPNPKKLWDAGFRAVGRYLTNVGIPGKALTRAEYDALVAVGFAVWLNFEEFGSFFTGYNGGIADALKADTARKARGLPRSVIYFSVESNSTFRMDYVDGAASVLGKEFTGVYCNAGPRAKAVCDAGYWCWEAGPGLPWDPRSHIRQYLPGIAFDGIPDAIDIDQTMKPDFGQVKERESDVALTPDQENAINFAVGLERKAEHPGVTNPAGIINPSNLKAIEGWNAALKWETSGGLPAGTKFSAEISA